MTPEQSAYHRAYYLANKEKVLARTKARNWYGKNKEKAAENNRIYRQRHAARLGAAKAARRATPEAQAREKEYAKQYHEKKSAIRNEKSRVWHAQNKERVSERHAKWARENPHICADRTRRRDASKLRATPAWADLVAIRKVYELAARLTKETGILHTVDHVIPLQGKNVCGLHHQDNLQILTKRENSKKHNRFPVDGITISFQDGS